MAVPAKAQGELRADPWGHKTSWEELRERLPADQGASRGSTMEELHALRADRRAYEGAPPVIPHATTMRGKCATCHGTSGPEAIRSSHLERAMCRQCHASSAKYDQHAYAP